MSDVRERRIADIGRRANRLLKAGFYAVEEVRWLAEFVRAGNCNLIEIEWLLANAERLAFDDGDLPK